MQYALLGRSGLRVSRLALGTWRNWGCGQDFYAAEDCLRAALCAGVNLVDVADVYAGGQAESWLGWMLGPADRGRVLIATKAFWPAGDAPNERGLSRKHLLESVEASLRRLRTDRIDLFLWHRLDAATPLLESVSATGDLLRQGKVLYWGLCSADAAAIAGVCRTADALGVPRPIANQPPYNLLDRRIEAEVIPACRALGLSQIAFSPLAQGVLSGKYLYGRPAASRAADPGRLEGMERHLSRSDAVAGLAALARDLSSTPAKLALAFCLRDDAVASAVFGASSPAQVLANVEAIEQPLSAEVRARLEAIFPAIV